MNFDTAKEATKENYGLILASMDRVNTSTSTEADNIEIFFNSLMGSSNTSNYGIYNFYCMLVLCIRLGYTNVNFMFTTPATGHKAESKTVTLDKPLFGINTINETFLGVKDLTTMKWGGGIVDRTDMFYEWDDDIDSNEASMELKIENDVFMNHGEMHSGLITDYFTSKFGEVCYTVEENDSGNDVYYYREDNKSSILALFNEITEWKDFVGEMYTVISNLRSNTITRLNTVLEETDSSKYAIPDLSPLISALSQLNFAMSGAWYTSLTEANEALQEMETTSFTATTIPAEFGAFEDALQELHNAVDTTYIPTVAEKAVAAMEKSNTPELNGFRKLWAYWIMKLVNRPSGFLSNYNGGQTALESLNERLAQAQYETSLIIYSNDYLPTPTFNCIYFDEVLGQYRLVITAVLCFDLVRVKINGVVNQEIPVSVFDNGSEFSALLTGAGEDDIITVQLVRSTNNQSSLDSNGLTLANPNYVPL